MSKGNLFLGYARGSVGDVTFTRIDGEQVARGRNRRPRNPQTPLQLLQRVILKTASQAYSMMQEICDHSFQGQSQGTPNQSIFVKSNVDMLRTICADLINGDDSSAILASRLTNFASRSCVLPEINPYVVSSGSISTLFLDFVGNSIGVPDIIFPEGTTTATVTYQQVLDAWQLQRGDQITVLCLSTDDTQDDPHFNGFRFARIIMEPAGGDLTVPFFDVTGRINDANIRNEGRVKGTITAERQLGFTSPDLTARAGRANSVAAGSIIVSRLSGGIWQRSSQSLVVRPWTGESTDRLVHNHGTGFLGDAVTSFISEANSSLYLNQAQY